MIIKFGRDLVAHELQEKDMEKFPLIIKLIDANDRLSVQVHPEDEFAKVNENGEYEKNELWNKVSAKPGAKIIYGVVEVVTKESFVVVEADDIESCLNCMEVSTGDEVNIYSGLNACNWSRNRNCKDSENLNTTYRVLDYNRVEKNFNKDLFILIRLYKLDILEL